MHRRGSCRALECSRWPRCSTPGAPDISHFLRRSDPQRVDAFRPAEVVAWAPAGDAVRILDQRRLPGAVVYRDLRTVDDVVDAIRTLAVRGAPAIGVAGAMGLVVALVPCADGDRSRFDAALAIAGERIVGARPTAVNLPWAIGRLWRRAAATAGDARTALAALRHEAGAILDEDRAMCRRIGEHGVALLRDGARVLTHCNAGALATTGIGTALAPVYVAVERGWRIEVFVDETRPLLQGARLTMWELMRAGVPCTVIADGAAASLLRRGAADIVLVGADRIAANGDVVNKIGSYGVALAAQAAGLPFVVCAPSSTIDPATANGDAVEIEERAAAEVTGVSGALTVPEGARVRNPAFDVTPAALVTAIVTDTGILRAPYAFRVGTMPTASTLDLAHS